MQNTAKAVSGLCLTLSVVILALLCNSVESANFTKIVGGSPTEISRVPYLVNLRVDGRFKCGGTLVASRYVITAAHCIIGVRRQTLTVVGGASRLSRRGVRRSVTKIRRPLIFNMQQLNKDIAILKLSRPMRGRFIKPIKLCNSKMKAGDKARVSGWGLTDENSSTVPDQVRTVIVPLISKKNCRKRYRGVLQMTSSMICAAVPGRRDSCSGDSGGPLVHNGRLCGVVSFGLGCARARYPGVYTSINRLKGFIRRAMRK